MDFVFKHGKSGELKTISLSEVEIQDKLSDVLLDELCCDCEPIGETNVVECGCDEYYEEFELMPRERQDSAISGKIQISMNGLRIELSEGVERLRSVAERILSDMHYDEEDLKESVNDVVRLSNVLNCVSYANDPGFTDLGNHEVEMLED